MLSSKGKYGGVLKHIDIAGSTDVPDFEVSTGEHKVKLVTEYAAFVDAIHGDTFLKHVDAHFRRTSVTVEGSVSGVKGRKGKTALLDLSSRQARIEDILGLFVSEPRAPMSGPITLKAKVEIPPGKERFLEKVKLDGAFGIDDGTFSKPETQKNVNELSAGARGEKMEDAETVLSDLKGQVVLEGGIAKFSNLTFGIPGAKARMHGTYNLLNHKIDLHGRMRVDTKISKTTTGVKSLLLKVMDPFFKKKKKGEIVPVHIAGTYEHPQFGLDLTEQEDAEHPRK
jgi:limonene-1,2-epoxide hydrolase